MLQNVNYGLIGCGMMGQEHIRNIALVPGARVTCVYDPVPELAEAAAQLAGGAAIAPTLAGLLADEGLDALVVVSPNHLHVAQLAQIAETRPLPLLMEKPLFTDPTDRAGVERIAADYPAPIWVAMEYRYMPPIAALIDEAASATGGVRMLSLREHRFPFLPKIGNWNRFNANSGGTYVEKCCHFFDLMRLILRSEPVRIMATGGQAVNHLTETYDGRTPDIWDHGYVIADFANGARAMLELCMFAEGSRFQEEICALGPEGKIVARVPGPGRFWPETAGPAPVPELEISPRHPKGPILREIPVDPALLTAGDHNGSTFYQHQRFNAVVRGEGRVEVGVEDGIRAVAMGLAAQESATTGRAVEL
ncbi:Gfo/Idh/MocA family protein [Alexandriicola marinus]|uniref:Gfo/Idh/MocA family protein n=1 Tax=Alexandriicola marinus TaxID=2081710 RepID=UPI001F0C178C|nr:Gfo/Idh/MocA family oxidoreductase [Alexandriicola marinus]